MDVPVLFAATVSDQEDAPEDLIVSWSSDVDGGYLDSTVDTTEPSADSILLTRASYHFRGVLDGSGKEDVIRFKLLLVVKIMCRPVALSSL